MAHSSAITDMKEETVRQLLKCKMFVDALDAKEFKDVDELIGTHIFTYPINPEYHENPKTFLMITTRIPKIMKNDKMYAHPRLVIDIVSHMDHMKIDRTQFDTGCNRNDFISQILDAVTTLSLNPLGVVSGQRIDSSIPNNIAGTVLNLEDGSEFKYANAIMDRNSVKLELDYIIQHFFSCACVPSSILGQSNVANVSETSITMLFQQTDNFARMYIMSLLEGFRTRLKYIRKLMEYQGKTISDEIFDSIDFEFNVARPVDTKADFENMKIQFDAGALSRRTFIDKSKYTTDTPLELERLADEAQQSDGNVTPVSESEDIETDIDEKVN